MDALAKQQGMQTLDVRGISLEDEIQEAAALILFAKCQCRMCPRGPDIFWHTKVCPV